jgi:UDP-glucose 4-epimerase
MVKAFEKASGRAIAYEVVARRLGDVAQCFADPSYAKKVLDWEAKFSIDKMCDDSWRWQKLNPKGYNV